MQLSSGPPWAAMALALALLLSACGDSGSPARTEPAAQPVATSTTISGTTTSTSMVDGAGGGSAPLSAFLGSYSLADDAFGTMVVVSVDDGTRRIETNALPDHETGDFPNPGNPNAISAQDLTWEFPVEGMLVGSSTEVRVPGVAVNGVKFEPGTAETVTCATGETYQVEALQDVYDLGFDFNNAHVQPTGEYHYHGISQLLVEAYQSDSDLVHIGFAADGFLMYYSMSGSLRSSYQLADEPRTGSNCQISLPGGEAFDLEGTAADGTYTSDWVFVAGSGDLDLCNGATIDGEYAYMITDTFPFAPRCLNGAVSADALGGPPPGGAP